VSFLVPPVFLISGASRVGKTSLATEIARLVRGSFVSFGDHVRSVAASISDGPAFSREALQDLGQQLVERDPRGFCIAVIERAGDNSSCPLVVDGLRHLSLLPILKDLLPGRDESLIFVESSHGIRKSRWDRDEPSEDEIVAVDSHPVEIDLSALRRRSDLIIDTSNGSESALKPFLCWLAGKYPDLASRASVATAAT
jgi:hypothetical protein